MAEGYTQRLAVAKICAIVVLAVYRVSASEVAMHRLSGLALACCLLTTDSSVGQQDLRAAFQKALNEATDAVGKPQFDTKVSLLLALLPQTPDGYYIVDGDLPVTEVEVRQIVRDRQAAMKGGKPWPDSARQGELIVMTENGIPTCYRTAAERRLTYAIDKNSFATAPEANAYENIRHELQSAMMDWQNACPECNIKFEPVITNTPVQGDANFIVKYIGEQGTLIARAFFPRDLPPKRYIQITQAYFNGGYDRIGVLRHELGHTLGYRHEHIRPEVPFQCAFNTEDKKWTSIQNATYDKFSVMHYPCEIQGTVVAGSDTFKLTNDDIVAHRKFYLEVCR